MLGMTDRDVVEKFWEIVNCGHLYVRDNLAPPSVKTQFIWSVGSRKDVIQVLESILPWLGERRSAKAKEALLYFKNNPPMKKGRPRMQQTSVDKHRA